MQVSGTTNVDAFVREMNKAGQDILNKAVPRALNRTGQMLVTQASREIRAAGYNFKAAEIKEAMWMRAASAGKLVATVKVRRRTKSLMLFNAKQTKTGVSVKVHGAAKTIKHAFIGQLRNGRMGVYIEDKSAGKTVLRVSKQHAKGSRGGWRDYPVRKLYGPSVGGVYGTDKLQAIVERFIRETFPARLAHEIKYLSR